MACSAAPTPATCCCWPTTTSTATQSGHYKNLQDAFAAIRCVDAPYPTDPAVWADADRQIREAAPFMEYGTFTGLRPARRVRDVAGAADVDARIQPPPRVPARSSSSPPRTIPATPYQAGVDLARQMAAALITFDGTQHTVVFNGDQCVDTAVVNFLIDSVVPPDGLRC